MDHTINFFTVRLELPVDQSVTVKFIYIRWNGKEVPFTKRGKYGVVHGSIEKRFHVRREEFFYCNFKNFILVNTHNNVCSVVMSLGF